jgi:lipoate-protein ligase B
VGRGAGGEGIIATPETLRDAGIEVHEVSRGGDVTWHGPGQLVGYPILDLAPLGRDLHRYLRALESALIDVLGDWDIEARTVAGRTGVWTDAGKIASIGIAVRRWVSYHGFALNVAPDLGFFDLIHPCGLRGIQVASMASMRGPGAAGLGEVRERTARAMAERLGFEGVRWVDAAELRREVPAGIAA